MSTTPRSVQVEHPETPSAPGAKREQRLIVVSNRLPVTIKKDASGKYTYKVGQSAEVMWNLTNGFVLADVVRWSRVGSVWMQKDHVLYVDRLARSRCKFSQQSVNWIRGSH